jgi:superfamily II DNA or RNA helicase
VELSYYRSHYAELRLPFAEPGKPGLRAAQLGALWALGSHFTVRKEPALVVMPTGSGKTAVLTLAPFLLQAERVLVITSNRLVRHQIHEELHTLKTLRNLGVVPDIRMPSPKVQEVKERVTDDAQWRQLVEFDAVVALPNSVSPAIEGIKAPPDGLFDLVLVDEAHHVPAALWNAILAALPASRRAFFTATPTRRDRKEIDAKLAYAYSVAAAQADGFFGAMRYVPVLPAPGESHDLAVARAAEAQLATDRASGLKHCLLVRTDAKDRANTLFELYRTQTRLRLAVVHSGRSYRQVQRALADLEAEHLDGVVCVDMMSEGFDFPRLKIAAIHVPHRSLEVTLQFVGRFARTNDASIGEAKFLAVPSDVADEVGRLYSESAVWDSLVADLSQARIEREQDVREVIAGFSSAGPEARGDVSNVSLYTLRPQFHVRVVETQQDVDIRSAPVFREPFAVSRWEVNDRESVAIVIANERERPKWSSSESFSRSEYELFVVYFDRATRLLFLGASRHSAELYDSLASSYTQGAHRNLPIYQLNRVLNGLRNAEYFSLGMRSRLVGDRIESYRILAGARAQRALSKADGRFFSRGHVMGRGERDGRTEVIGYSSGSKVWSTRRDQVPVLLGWCRDLAKRMSDSSPMEPQGDLDYLPVGERAERLPAAITFVDWTEDAYREPLPELVLPDGVPVLLADCDISPGAMAEGGQAVLVEIQSQESRTPQLRFDVNGWPHFAATNEVAAASRVRVGREESSLLAYVNSELLDVYGPDLSRTRGREVFRGDPTTFEPFDRERIQTLDWVAERVDITREFGAPTGGRCSVQGQVSKLLTAQDGIVVYDHRKGEVADFVQAIRGERGIALHLYHCKGSSGPQAGSRVEDAYEVCGQVVRSVRWVGNERGLAGRLLKRLDTGSQLVAGSVEDLRALRTDLGRVDSELHVWLVQPGFSRSSIEMNVLDVLAAAHDYVKRGRATMHVLGSD